jgi:prepilin-type processing-associated H-X9-DG protein
LQYGHEITTSSDTGRHQGGSNYAMADGHVLWLRPEKVGATAGVHLGRCPAVVCDGVYLGN